MVLQSLIRMRDPEKRLASEQGVSWFVESGSAAQSE